MSHMSQRPQTRKKIPSQSVHSFL